MDFKMKFEMKYYREKTSKFNGKKGLSWHGCMIYSRYTEQEKQEQEGLLPFKINYIDHISSGDTKQDWKAVLSYFEACLLQIKKELPHVDELYLDTDNAKCYKNPELILLLNIIAKHHGFKIITFIHTGVQDGKSALDGYFVKGI